MRIKSKTLRTRDRRKVRGLATYVSERTSRKKKKLGRSLDLFPKRDHRHLIFMSGLIGSPRRVGVGLVFSVLPFQGLEQLSRLCRHAYHKRKEAPRRRESQARILRIQPFGLRRMKGSRTGCLSARSPAPEKKSENDKNPFS